MSQALVFKRFYKNMPISLLASFQNSVYVAKYGYSEGVSAVFRRTGASEYSRSFKFRKKCEGQ